MGLAGVRSIVENSSCLSNRPQVFAPGELVDGDYPALDEDDESKLVHFCERATEMFGDREHFFASSRWRFVRVTWERDTRTDAQRNNVD